MVIDRVDAYLKKQVKTAEQTKKAGHKSYLKVFQCLVSVEPAFSETERQEVFQMLCTIDPTPAVSDTAQFYTEHWVSENYWEGTFPDLVCVVLPDRIKILLLGNYFRNEVSYLDILETQLHTQFSSHTFSMKQHS